MKAEPKSFASLSPTLLARKGQARPAMRPQMVRAEAPRLDDLGWDDIGLDIAPPVPPPATPITPDVVISTAAAAAPIAATLKEIEDAFAETRAAQPQDAADPQDAPLARAEPGGRDKAAFTLRLNGERHLKLRLACAVRHRSAQRIVTEALDAYLASLPDLNESDWLRSALVKN